MSRLAAALVAPMMFALPAAAGVSRHSVQALNDAFAAAMVKGDPSAVAAFYTEDGQLIFFKGQTVKGRAAIQDTLTGMFKGMKVKAMTITSQESHPAGPGWLVDQGTYEMTSVGPDGKEETSKARYLQILRKGKDGRWLLFRDCPLPD